MKKACPYCGRIHDKKFVCKNKAKVLKEREYEQYQKNIRNKRFRSSAKWKKKAEIIRERDLDLCLICKKEGKYESADSVHHIISLNKDFEKRLDDDNLICLCRYHHELAEKGEFSKAFLVSLINK